MHSFHYLDGRLFCEEVELASAAERFGTPLYVYSAGTILDHHKRLDEALAGLDHLICYAVKANSNRAILHLLGEAGAGFDIVSGGELYRVIRAGGDASKCTFAGVGKSREEIEYALEQHVYSFHQSPCRSGEIVGERWHRRGPGPTGCVIPSGEVSSPHSTPRDDTTINAGPLGGSYGRTGDATSCRGLSLRVVRSPPSH